MVIYIIVGSKNGLKERRTKCTETLQKVCIITVNVYVKK